MKKLEGISSEDEPRLTPEELGRYVQRKNGRGHVVWKEVMNLENENPQRFQKILEYLKIMSVLTARKSGSYFLGIDNKKIGIGGYYFLGKKYAEDFAEEIYPDSGIKILKNP